MFDKPIYEENVNNKICITVLGFGILLSNTLAAQTSLGINFAGPNSAPETYSQIAGAVPQAYWNMVWGAAGTASLVGSQGQFSGASAAWSADNTWNLPIASVAGNNNMMHGYLDNASGNPVNVTISGITPGTYNVYVYADGDNGSATRTAIYQISGPGIALNSITATDPANTNFGGTFVQANNSSGNYVLFSGVSISSSIKITATPGPTTDVRRAPVNAIQLIPTSAAPPPPPAPGFYVSSANGNDSWSGTLPSPNSNNTDGPFLTLARAQSAMRTSSNKTTYIRAGTYRPTSSSGLGCLFGSLAAINLVPADSGETWSYYPADGVGTAILDGGAPAVTQSGPAPNANARLACAFSAEAIAPTALTNVTITGLQFQNWYYSALAVNSNSNTGITAVTFTNNTIHDTRLPQAAGVDLSCTSSTISNNYFYNMSGAAILTGSTSTGCAVTNQTIANNFLLNTCIWNGAQPGGGDCGAIYTLLPSQSNSNIVIANNYIRDVNTVTNGAGLYGNCCAMGIYLDGNTYNVNITGNVITGIKSACIYFHGGGLHATGNLCDVGTPANGPQFVLTDDVQQGNDITGGNLFANNIVVGNNPGTVPAAPWGVFHDQIFSGGLFNPATIANNVYYNYGGTAINSTGGQSSDTNPVYANPQLSCWGVSVASGSPVFNSPVSFPGIKGGWGPPGFAVPQTGTPPSWPHGC